MPLPNVSKAGFQVLTHGTNTTSWVGVGPTQVAKAVESATLFHFFALNFQKINHFLPSLEKRLCKNIQTEMLQEMLHTDEI